MQSAASAISSNLTEMSAMGAAQMASLLQAGMNVSHVLTHRFRAEQFKEGFEVMRSGNCGKVILDWSA